MRAAVRAEGLGFASAQRVVLQGLNFELRPGLALVRGGEGRGKTALLRLLAGALEPTSGTLVRGPGPVFFEDASAPALDDAVVSDWLCERAACFPGWREPLAQRLVEALRLTEHVGKTFHMLSAGSRRKAVLAAAVASGAPLTLLDVPFAALDARSRGVLCEVLDEASTSDSRVWVVADHEVPAGLEVVRWSAVIDLGD